MGFLTHWYDLVFLAVIALLIFGPKRLPEIGSSVGKTIKEFQKSMHEITEPKHDDAALTPPATAPVAQQIPGPALAASDVAPAAGTPVTADQAKE